MRKIFLLFFTLASVMCYAQQNTPTTDRGVVINGVRWATRNVDAPGTFVAQSENSGMLFQWNRRQGWTATSNVIGLYIAYSHWRSSTNAIEIDTTWERTNDPCPSGWRVPTRAELESLSRAGSTWITTRRGVSGLLFGTTPNQLFLPAAGLHSFEFEGFDGVGGYYWSSSAYSTHYGWFLCFSDGYVRPTHRYLGLSVRCVAE